MERPEEIGAHDFEMTQSSFGGAVAIVLATKRPDLVARLALAEPVLAQRLPHEWDHVRDPAGQIGATQPKPLTPRPEEDCPTAEPTPSDPSDCVRPHPVSHLNRANSAPAVGIPMT